MYRRPVTAKNIEKVQKQFERELSLKTAGQQTVLNGWVQSVTSECASTCSENVEYRFQYTPKDTEIGDNYVYTIDTFPIRKHVQDISSCSASIGKIERASSMTSPVTCVLNDEHKTDSLVTAASKQSNKSAYFRSLSTKTIVSDSKETDSDQVTKLKPNDGNDADIPSEKPLQRKVSLCPSEYYHNSRSRLSSAPTKKTRKASEISRPSTVTSSRLGNVSANKRKSVSYDPELDKANAFIHGGGHNFSSANAHLTPIRNGMKHLQMSYTETNLETNQSIIFLDLLRTSHQKHQLRESQVRNIERRLAAKRSNPLYSTSYYEHMHVPDPFRRKAKKTARSVAQKKLERKEKIKQLSDELHTGYVPTQLTMKIADQTEVDDLGRKCRYLRCKPPPE